MLVCIAGTDGSGKSTLVASLQEQMSKKCKCSQLRLYDTVVFSKLQKKAAIFLKKNKIENTHYNLVIAYLMFELQEKSFPKLTQEIQKNDIVIMDRYIETIDFIVKNYKVDKRILNKIIEKFQKPDIYIYLKVNPNICYKRIISLRKPGDGEELHEIIAAAKYYDNNIKNYNFTVVNGEQTKKDIVINCLNIIQTSKSKLKAKGSENFERL
ncbi:deoxynucleoside kinase [Clostridium felsineum]|uniref:deoxynucleoside kinase n=1 Tax=Clostridium felsineum TaxID=36839 RepID=UPI00098C7A1B|nr:deoxynucleoside kinase [Clostridium felsineum]URZ18156.1 Thymidylate kinase [Clostridium felsineum DSM 794]